jgi:hypothetical protein
MVVMAEAIIEGIRDRVAVAIKVNQSVGIQVPENRHNDLLEALFTTMCGNQNDFWTFVAVSNTFNFLSKTYKEVTDHNNINFIDCISRAAGVTGAHTNCTYIESPTMLEKVGLEIVNNFNGVKPEIDKYIVIDSLSALMIYNDPEIIREFVSLLMNRTRAHGIHVVSIMIEEEVDSNKVMQLNDKIVVLRDSFID